MSSTAMFEIDATQLADYGYAHLFGQNCSLDLSQPIDVGLAPAADVAELDSKEELEHFIATLHCKELYRFQWVAAAYLILVAIFLVFMPSAKHLTCCDDDRQCCDSPLCCGCPCDSNRNRREAPRWHDLPPVRASGIVDDVNVVIIRSHHDESNEYETCRTCLQPLGDGAVSCPCGAVLVGRIRESAFTFEPGPDDDAFESFESSDASESSRSSCSAQRLTCSVCLEALQRGDQVVALPPCAHVFHVDCITAWLATKSKCPTCREHVRVLPLPGFAAPPVRAPTPHAVAIAIKSHNRAAVS